MKLLKLRRDRIQMEKMKLIEFDY